MRVALIHDWLTGMRGGERCLEVFCELFPGATLYTLFHFRGSCSPRIESMNIRTSFLQRAPGLRRYYRRLLPLFPLAVESFDLRGYDLVLSSSHCVAKGAIPPPGTRHIAYIHTPMRYAWDMAPEYFGRAGRVARWASAPILNYLRVWDTASSARVDHFVANSRHVALRIGRYYRRRATVIHPPVETGRFAVSREDRGYYLIVSALVPYKRVDVAVEAFNRLRIPLRIVGQGPEARRLQRMAQRHVAFLGWQDDEALAEHYAGCRALVFPGVEDFGIVPLEAMAAGKPVIAYAAGGVLESVVPPGDPHGRSPTGLLYRSPTPEGLMEAVQRFEKGTERFDPEAIRAHAQRFDRRVFKEAIRRFVMEHAVQESTAHAEVEHPC